MAEVQEAGAHFGVSPGLNPRVVRAAQVGALPLHAFIPLRVHRDGHHQKLGFPYAPGIATPSEVEIGIDMGVSARPNEFMLNH